VANSSDHPNVCVFASTLFLTVGVEAGAEADEIHFHPGGQGFWITRMLRHLGERPVLVAPVGGESGRVVLGLAPAWRVDVSPVDMVEDSPAYLHDRRSGERREIAHTRMPTLDRHAVDDLYGRVLARASAAGACVVTGKSAGDTLALEFYQRLGADLASTGVLVVGDLHGEELLAFLAGGPLHTLKVSDQDLEQDGVLPRGASLAERFGAMDHYRHLGAERVVVSSAGEPTVARFGNVWLRADSPKLEPADPRGSGDAMTAGLASAALRRMEPERTLQLACAAGAANVTRRGLASADPELVVSLADHVQVERLAEARR
jgi:1-phosphofructokinase